MEFCAIYNTNKLQTCASVSCNVWAKYKRSGPTIYCCLSNSASNLSSWSGVKMVRTRLLLQFFFALFIAFDDKCFIPFALTHRNKKLYRKRIALQLMYKRIVTRIRLSGNLELSEFFTYIILCTNCNCFSWYR